MTFYQRKYHYTTSISFCYRSCRNWNWSPRFPSFSHSFSHLLKFNALQMIFKKLKSWNELIPQYQNISWSVDILILWFSDILIFWNQFIRDKVEIKKSPTHIKIFEALILKPKEKILTSKKFWGPHLTSLTSVRDLWQPVT